MDLLAVIAFFIILSIGINYMNLAKRVDKCDGHKWVIETTGMVCDKCRKRPEDLL